MKNECKKRHDLSMKRCNFRLHYKFQSNLELTAKIKHCKKSKYEVQ